MFQQLTDLQPQTANNIVEIKDSLIENTVIKTASDRVTTVVPESTPPTPISSNHIATGTVANSNTTWTTSPRIQSMVVQNDGSIILCDNDSEIDTSSAPRIEVVEILSSTNYLQGNKLVYLLILWHRILDCNKISFQPSKFSNSHRNSIRLNIFT